MRPKFRSSYDVYKTEYLQLKQNHINEIPNFSKIVEQGYDQAILQLIPLYIVINDDPYEIFKLHEFGKDTGYRANIYETSANPLECNGKKLIVNNPDQAFNFVNDKKSIYTDTWINKLPVNDSTGMSRWESYNWILARDKTRNDKNERKFHMVFGKTDDSFKAEIGLKHSMLGLGLDLGLGKGNDFYAGGEMRIVHDIKNFNRIIVQVNIDPGTFDPGFANIIKKLCTRSVECSEKNILNVDKKNICPFGNKKIENIVCENFNDKYNHILDFKMIAMVPGSGTGSPDRHFEDQRTGTREDLDKFQKILHTMTMIIKNVIKHIFQQMINNPHYSIQMIGDVEWYSQGLEGYQGLHWYHYNDTCPTQKYIKEANKWAAEHGYTQLFINN